MGNTLNLDTLTPRYSALIVATKQNFTAALQTTRDENALILTTKFAGFPESLRPIWAAIFKTATKLSVPKRSDRKLSYLKIDRPVKLRHL